MRFLEPSIHCRAIGIALTERSFEVFECLESFSLDRVSLQRKIWMLLSVLWKLWTTSLDGGPITDSVNRFGLDKT